MVTSWDMRASGQRSASFPSALPPARQGVPHPATDRAKSPLTPARAASKRQRHDTCPGGGIGRRAGFRYQWLNGRGGSSPLLGTMSSFQEIDFIEKSYFNLLCIPPIIRSSRAGQVLDVLFSASAPQGIRAKATGQIRLGRCRSAVCYLTEGSEAEQCAR